MPHPPRPRHLHSRWLVATCCGLFLALVQGDVALAHMETPVTPDNVWRSWNFDPLVLVPLVLLTALYVSGLRTIWRLGGTGRGISRAQAAAFAAGIGVLVIALVSPVDQMGGALFSMHMVQHLLLVVVAAPLLVYAAPLAPVLLALPHPLRRRAGRLSGTGWGRHTGHAITNPLFVWWAQAIVLWLWHIPAFYGAALRSSLVHALEHMTFLLTALLFWWLVIQPQGRRRLSLGLAVLFIFTAMIQSSALGALITFAPSRWYEAHDPYVAAWNISPLADQQLAGLIMWVPGGLVYLGAGLAAFLLWLRSMEPSDERASGGRVLDSVPDMNRFHPPRSG